VGGAAEAAGTPERGKAVITLTYFEFLYLILMFAMVYFARKASRKKKRNKKNKPPSSDK